MRTSVDDLDPTHLAAREALVAATRELNLAVGTTAIDGAPLDEVTAAVAELTRVLGKESTERVVRGGFLGPRERALRGEPVRLHQLNPALPAVDLLVGHDDGPDAMVAALTDGRPVGLTATADLTVDSLREGPPDSVHGGTLSFLMDCMLGVLVQASGVASVTGKLDLRYLRRTPLDEPITLRSRIVSREGRKIMTEGSVEHAGTRTVAATGLFVAIDHPGSRAQV
ncbi:MAG: PaaI family thioesterase [Nocardioides sp.]|nr:PaaI family thioesterase [Nocardioides sp.]